jgi:hypothetical protein
VVLIPDPEALAYEENAIGSERERETRSSAAALKSVTDLRSATGVL